MDQNVDSRKSNRQTNGRPALPLQQLPHMHPSACAQSPNKTDAEEHPEEYLTLAHLDKTGLHSSNPWPFARPWQTISSLDVQLFK